jgi:hypothetical protein
MPANGKSECVDVALKKHGAGPREKTFGAMKKHLLEHQTA